MRERDVIATRSSLLFSLSAALAMCASASARPLSSQEPGAAAIAYVRAHATSLGLTPADVDDVIVVSQTVSGQTGVSHVYLRQRRGGIDVWGADMTVNIARDGRVVSRAGNFVARLDAARPPTRPKLTPIEAAQAAAKHLELTFTSPLRIVSPAKGAAQETALTGGGIAASAIPVKLVFYATQPATVHLAWHVEIEERSAQHWWVVLVDALTGALLEKTDRVAASAVV